MQCFSHIDGVEKMFENIKHDNKDEQLKNDTSPMDVERVQSTIKQFVRDWSSEGEAEREMCYTPILDEIGTYIIFSRYQYSSLVNFYNTIL